MNKRQLAGKVAQKIGSSRTSVEQTINATLDAITEALTNNIKVRLVGFGNFIIRTRKGRVGRNPQSGEKIQIAASKSPGFVPGINLKKAIKSK